MSIRLGVNVDHVATLRQARRARYPDPVLAASVAELGGAGQITIHLREDRRHISDRDLRIMRDTVKTLLNLEMAATQEMIKIAYEVKPDVCTLVPERRDEITTEGGLDVIGQRDTIQKAVRTLRDGDIDVALFVDPDVEQVKAAHRVGALRIELHTGRYCDARGQKERSAELSRIVDSAKTAAKLGIEVAAGHGLNYDNVQPIAAIREIVELNIGHAIVARSVFIGFQAAVREMVDLMHRSRHSG